MDVITGEIVEIPGLSEQETQVYVHACAGGEVRVSDLEVATGLQRDEVHRAVDHLTTLRLLRGQGREGPFSVVPPETARVQLITPALQELRRREDQVNALRVTYDSLAHVYESAAQARLRRAKLAGEVISDLAAVHEAIAGLAAECTEEVLTSHPGGARPPEVLHESLPRTLELLSRGISMRTLYQHSARFDRATTAHVECMTESGAQVRTLADGFAQIIVFDKRKALMPLHDDDHGAVLVRDLSVVDFAVAAFERSWSVASPFSVAYSRKMVAETSEDVKLSIMRLLADGEEDRKIAARVGVSLRSYQRHVSEIMKRLGARTRLHAGYLIREHGLLEEHPAHSDCP